MPALTDQHRRLATLAGHFAGRDEVAATKWGPGGAADADLVLQPTLGGAWLALDHVQRRGGAVIFEAHGRLTWDTETSDYAMLWFDSFGFVPPSAARGNWTDTGLVLVRASPRGMARHTLALREEGRRLTAVLENSFDAGASWSPVMTGDYRRVG